MRGEPMDRPALFSMYACDKFANALHFRLTVSANPSAA
jgi:hypothetical protein